MVNKNIMEILNRAVGTTTTTTFDQMVSELRRQRIDVQFDYEVPFYSNGRLLQKRLHRSVAISLNSRLKGTDTALTVVQKLLERRAIALLNEKLCLPLELEYSAEFNCVVELSKIITN